MTMEAAFMRHRITALALLGALAACTDVSTSPTVGRSLRANASGAPTTVAYTTVGASTFTVPAGVTSLSIVAVGGGGGGSIVYAGGSGGMVTTTLSVTPGQVLDLFVGA